MSAKEAYYTLENIIDETDDNLIKYKLSQVKDVQIWFEKYNTLSVKGIYISWSDPDDLQLDKGLTITQWKYTKIFISPVKLPDEALLDTRYDSNDAVYVHGPSSTLYKFKYYFNDIRDGCNKHVGEPIVYGELNSNEQFQELQKTYYIYIIPVSSTGTHTLDDCCYIVDLSSNTVNGRERFSFRFNFSKSASNEIVEYTGTNQNYTPARFVYNPATHWYDFNPGSWGNAFFLPRPCMLKYDGTVDYYLNPVDYRLKEDGTPSDISNLNYDGNAMMEWGKDGYIFYYTEPPTEKLTEYEFIIEKVPYGELPLSNNMVSYPFINSNHTLSRKFYTPIFLGMEHAGKLRSMCPTNDINESNGFFKFKDVIELAENNNIKEDDRMWTIEMHQTHVFINMLFLLMFKSTSDEILDYKKFKLDNRGAHSTEENAGHSYDEFEEGDPEYVEDHSENIKTSTTVPKSSFASAIKKFKSSTNKLFDILTDGEPITENSGIKGYQIFGMFDYIPHKEGVGRAKLGLILRIISRDNISLLFKNSWKLRENEYAEDVNHEYIPNINEYINFANLGVNTVALNQFNLEGIEYTTYQIECSRFQTNYTSNRDGYIPYTHSANIIKMGIKNSEFNVPFFKYPYEDIPETRENVYLNANFTIYYTYDDYRDVNYFCTHCGSIFGINCHNYNTGTRVLAGLQCIPLK